MTGNVKNYVKFLPNIKLPKELFIGYGVMTLTCDGEQYFASTDGVIKHLRALAKQLTPRGLTAYLCYLNTECSHEFAKSGSSKDVVQIVNYILAEAVSPKALVRTLCELNTGVTEKHIADTVGFSEIDERICDGLPLFVQIVKHYYESPEATELPEIDYGNDDVMMELRKQFVKKLCKYITQQVPRK